MDSISPLPSEMSEADPSVFCSWMLEREEVFLI